jgi:hypothetical protein
MSFKKLRKGVMTEVQRQFALRSLTESRRNSITANLLTSLLDLPLSVKLDAQK